MTETESSSVKRSRDDGAGEIDSSCDSTSPPTKQRKEEEELEVVGRNPKSVSMVNSS
eukprot:CAMPEP_0181342068 /NCGR_PEP_ID=MMETSP1101-20121128/30793_1 /TAXON_ID=46948 /ORGANISM="Rhodomonas abbreviata, Strain Caron Lab Isolate" /LENGTH=56 /DNA_ID=CAMNT_0023453481 /DNA_START=217 /DNA_END=387 /DNA_ORIENTATION=-